MTVTFATCERRRALEFLQKLYPSTELSDTEASVKGLLDIIEADEMRVCDPEFHGGQLIFGRHKKPDTAKRTQEALKAAGLWFSRNDDTTRGGTESGCWKEDWRKVREGE